MLANIIGLQIIILFYFVVQGKCGTAPAVEELAEALKSHDLFIYFGHGSGTHKILELILNIIRVD